MVYCIDLQNNCIVDVSVGLFIVISFPSKFGERSSIFTSFQNFKSGGGG
jgi:hypothetical protein